MIASVRCPNLVGRASETAILRERFTQAEHGSGSITFVSGDAGIGKTRLIGDFLQSAELRKMPRAIGYCMEHARSPLAPLSDIVWSLTDEHPELLADAPITRRVLAHLVPGLATDNDSSIAPSDARAQYAALADLLRRAAEKRPAIVVIEDAQWADLTTIDFLTFFASRVGSTRVMLIVMHRPLSDRPDPLADSFARMRANHNVHAMNVRPLMIGEMRKLSELALGENEKLSDELLRKVHELADGNPLFAEELLGTALSSPAGTVSLPASLRTLFLDRFSGLDPDDRETLTEAAVMGRSFDPAFLARLTGKPIERVLRTLRTARELQLVDDEGEGIVFRHALVREALYASLLGAEARRLHHRMAEELETLPETLSRTFALAYHWWSAREPVKAFEANSIAGERAMKHLATTDAATFFERALSCAPDEGDTRAQIEWQLGAASFASGFPERATAAYKRALDYYTNLGDMRKIAEVSLELGRNNAALGRGDESLDWRMRAVEATENVDDDAFRYTVYAHLAFWLSIRGETELAHDYVTRARATGVMASLAARLDLGEAEVISHFLTGDMDQGETCFRELTAVISAEGTATQIVRLYANYGFLNGVIGNIKTALEAVEYARSRADESLGMGYQISLLATLGMLSVKVGKISEGRAHFKSAEQLVATLGQTSTRWTSTLTQLGLELAMRFAGSATFERTTELSILEEAINSREHIWMSEISAAFAGAAAARGEIDRARAIVARVLALYAQAPIVPALALVAAEFGTTEDTARATSLFDLWPAGIRPIRAYRALFDAYIARRAGRAYIGLATDAAQRFEALTLPILAARAYEVAGDAARALAIYEAHDCTGDIERIRNGGAPKRLREQSLSARELEVLPHVLRGRSNAEIAGVLNISERTVESHVRSILSKRGVKSRLQLVSDDTGGG